VVSGHDVHWRQSIEVVEGLDYLRAAPELALERRKQEIAAVQNPYIPTLLIELADYCRHPTETSAAAIFDSADPVGVIEMYECQIRVPAIPGFRCRCIAGNQQQRSTKNNAYVHRAERIPRMAAQ
jgi:hypothetical protein